MTAVGSESDAALPGGTECRGQHIGDDLLGQGAGIDDHGVLAAGLGDQRHDGAGFVRQGFLNGARRFRRSRECDAADEGIVNQWRTDTFTVTGK